MDTESIVAELVKAKSLKKDNLVLDQKKLSWKQDAWKELNTKIYSLYSKTLSNMRFKSDYSKKKTTATSDAVSVVTSGEAPNSVQTLNITQMAKAGYLTGAKVGSGTETVAATSKVTDKLQIAAGSKFTVSSGDTTKEIEITEETTINDIVADLREVGISANFDEKNQRFFLSAKSTGAANDFQITASDADGNAALDKLGLSESSGAHRINGEDSIITLNGVTYTSANNTHEINGLTITVNKETTDDITLNTTEDTDGIYDMVKNFFKEYNALINEMDKLYNADSASKYDMLTDEEREAMNEDDIEEWDGKIKSALLRRDSNLSTIASAMKQVMMTGVTMSDGSTKYLSNFGINTLGYFNSAENEKNAYHIDGDEDDTSTATNTDKLKAAIASNPDEVAEFFSSLAKNLYDKMDSLMKSSDYRSAYTAYDDKLLKEEYDAYTEKIARQEEIIANYEDRYYAKFAKMETAMAKLNSQQSSLSSLFG